MVDGISKLQARKLVENFLVLNLISKCQAAQRGKVFKFFPTMSRVGEATLFFLQLKIDNSIASLSEEENSFRLN